jgi:uncharacterized lipoprotein YbaY
MQQALAYDPAKIIASHRYMVSAQIEVEGRYASSATRLIQ